jgi:alpha-amylase/alpha-mannosidase (GH57 family)
VIPILARNGIRWTATDRRVLARSGKWGYPADDPDVFCQPYHAGDGDGALSIFFRDGWLSDHIGFHYQQHPDYVAAAREFLEQMKQRFARAIRGSDDRILTVIMDGENAWSAYRDDARPFLHALYRLLEQDAEIETVTFTEYLDGSGARALAPHPLDQQPRVHDLYPGSWADERGSGPGVDLGTWIGEPEENDAWALLGEARDHLDESEQTLETCPAAFQAMYAAEGSDWFWWLGTDEESGRDAELDGIFHAHLRAVYHALGEHAPEHVTPHVRPSAVLLTRDAPVVPQRPDALVAALPMAAGVTAAVRDPL